LFYYNIIAFVFIDTLGICHFP